MYIIYSYNSSFRYEETIKRRRRTHRGWTCWLGIFWRNDGVILQIRRVVLVGYSKYKLIEYIRTNKTKFAIFFG